MHQRARAGTEPPALPGYGRHLVGTDAGANLLLMVVVIACSCGVARAAASSSRAMCSGTAIPAGLALPLFRTPHGWPDGMVIAPRFLRERSGGR
jgi:hypothetical protein